MADEEAEEGEGDAEENDGSRTRSTVEPLGMSEEGEDEGAIDDIFRDVSE